MRPLADHQLAAERASIFDGKRVRVGDGQLRVVTFVLDYDPVAESDLSFSEFSGR